LSTSISGDYYESIAIHHQMIEEAPQSDYASLQVVFEEAHAHARARAISEPPSPLEQALLRATRTSGPDGERAFVRIELDRPARFRALDASESVIGSIRNLSVRGAYIQSSKLTIQPGTLVAFGCYVYHRGQRRALRSMGRVVWVDGRGIGRRGFGLVFVEPPPEMLRIIDEMVQDQRRGGLIS
jgi:hypothetical protein